MPAHHRHRHTHITEHRAQAKKDLKIKDKKLLQADKSLALVASGSASGGLCPGGPGGAGGFGLCAAPEVLAVTDPTYVDSLFHLSFKGKQNSLKKRNHLTPKGQLVAAIRRITSQAAANAFGTAVLADLDGKQINQCERLFGACRIASLRSFHDEVEYEISNLDRGFVIATHSYSLLALSP